MKKRIITGMLAALIGFSSVSIPQAEALSCAMKKPVDQEIERSSVVFKGRVVKMTSSGLTVFQTNPIPIGTQVEGDI